MKEDKLSVMFFSKEHALDFPVRTILPVLLNELTFDQIEEMYIVDIEEEKRYFVDDFSSYNSLEEIIQPNITDEGLSIFDFDIQLKNGVGIYTHDNLSIEAPDDETLFKYVDFIFRHFHIDAVAAKAKIQASPDEEVLFDIA